MELSKGAKQVWINNLKSFITETSKEISFKELSEEQEVRNFERKVEELFYRNYGLQGLYCKVEATSNPGVWNIRLFPGSVLLEIDMNKE